MTGAGVCVWVVVPGADGGDVAVGAGPWGQVYVPVRGMGGGTAVGFAPASFSGPGAAEHVAAATTALSWMKAAGCDLSYAGWSETFGCAVAWSPGGQAFVGVQPPG